MGCDCDNTTFSPWKIGSDDDKKRVVHIFRNINLESLRVHLSARKVDGGRCNFFAAMFSPVVVLDLYCILYYSSHVKSDTSYNVLDDVTQATRSECANVTSGNLPGPLPWVNTVIFIIIATVTIIIIIIIISIMISISVVVTAIVVVFVITVTSFENLIIIIMSRPATVL